MCESMMMMMMKMKWIQISTIVILIMTMLTYSNAYVHLEKNCLIPPFTQFKEHTGQRSIPYWDFGGSVIAKENFLRLTPDRQSKRGYLLNTQRLAQKDFGLQLRFRISGGGKNLYGDGVGFWLTHKTRAARFEEGSLLGHTDAFVGLGFMFDTFRNTESGHIHKDISMIVGTSRTEPVNLGKDRPGCESHYRYYEGREDFDVSRESKARIILKDNVVTMDIDQYGKDQFRRCFEANLNDYDLPPDWQDNYYFSISASTGSLADNHDILELKVAEPGDFEQLLKAEEEDSNTPVVQIDLHKEIRADEVGEHVNDLAFEVADIKKSLTKLQHKLEHDIEHVKMHLERMIKKLEEKEKGSSERISGLEEAAKLEKKLEDRVRQIERDLGMSVSSRLEKVDHIVDEKISNIEASGGSWKLPLLGIVILVGIYMAYTARSLKKLHARDKLI